MTDSSILFRQVEQIANESSKNAKEALVGSYAATDDDFKRVLEYAYNPFKTYGLRKRPETLGDNVGHEFDAGTWELLDDLIARRITGNEAIEAVRGEMTALSKESAELFWRIVTKDLRAGFSESTINKAVKGLIPDFPYMRCSLPDKSNMAKWDWGKGVISQEKADGMFVNVNVDDVGFVWVNTRQGSPVPLDNLPELAWALGQAGVHGHQLHGEMTVVGPEGKVLPREQGNGMLNSVIQGGTLDAGCHARIDLWDMIPLTMVRTKGKFDQPYAKRLSALLGAIRSADPRVIKRVDVISTRVVRSHADAMKHYRELLMSGKEGTILKHSEAAWKDGTSKDQVKLKLEVDVDLKIVGIVPGREGTKNEGRAGSFACESACGGLRVDVTVKNEALRDRVDADVSEFIGRILTVRANSVMPPSESSELHSLFLPRMVEADYRADKAEADDLASIKNQFEAAVAA